MRWNKIRECALMGAVLANLVTFIVGVLVVLFRWYV